MDDTRTSSSSCCPEQPSRCRPAGLWIRCDPKPRHPLDLALPCLSSISPCASVRHFPTRRCLLSAGAHRLQACAQLPQPITCAWTQCPCRPHQPSAPSQPSRASGLPDPSPRRPVFACSQVSIPVLSLARRRHILFVALVLLACLVRFNPYLFFSLSANLSII